MTTRRGEAQADQHGMIARSTADAAVRTSAYAPRCRGGENRPPTMGRRAEDEIPCSKTSGR